jgi:hypothetical protein
MGIDAAGGEQRGVPPAGQGEQPRARQQPVDGDRPVVGVAGSNLVPTTSTGLAVVRFQGPA